MKSADLPGTAAVSLSDFTDGPRGADDTALFARAMDYCRDNPGTTLMIPPGTYTVTSALARETREHVLRGDWGANPQPTMFTPKFPYSVGIDFRGQKGTTVLARGATLMVDGFMEPVSLRDCENVHLVGLTIDHTRKPYSRAVVREVDEKAEGDMIPAVLEFDAETPLVPPSDGVRGTELMLRYIACDPRTGRRVRPGIRIDRIADERTVYCHVSRDLRPGMLYYCIHTYHSRPAILIERAENVRLTDVTIHSQPGMGIVGNRSENLTFTRLHVVPSAGHHWSTNTDATHFTSIKGLLRFEDCEFEGQGDDSTNVHGYYQAIVRRESDTVAYLQEKTPDGTHAQSLDYPDPGDVMELTSYHTLEVADTYRVVECTPMPDEWMCRVTLDHPLPEVTDGWLLTDVTRLPRLEFVGCTCSNHFARGILVKTRSVLVEGNTFRNVFGAAVKVAAEASWCESASPADVVIRSNRILYCSGEAGIAVYADSDDPRGQSIFRVTIEDNVIDEPGNAHAIFCRNVRGLTIARNHACVAGTPVVIEHCADVSSDA